MKNLFNINFDLSGNESARVTRMSLLSKIVPLGNLNSGPGLRCLVILTFLHYFSKPVYWLVVRQESRIYRIYQFLKRKLRQ